MKNKKNIVILSILIVFVILGSGCLYFFQNKGNGQINNNMETIQVEYDELDLDESFDKSSITNITFESNKITSSNENYAKVENNVVKINSAGVYYLTGTNSNAQIVVELSKEDNVKLILDNLNLTCENSSPIFIKKAKKAVITIASNSQNNISDGSNYTFESEESDEPNATIFSKSDLTINGAGSLNITANYEDGIASKGGVKIVNGNITINSSGDAIRGKDYVYVKNGNFNIVTGGGSENSNSLRTFKEPDNMQQLENMQKPNENDLPEDFEMKEDMKQFRKDMELPNKTEIPQNMQKPQDMNNMKQLNESNSTENLKQLPENVKQPNKQEQDTSDEETKSTKGIKAGSSIVIQGGNFKFNTLDDSIHSNGTVQISDGNIEISSGDDGIHADESVYISNGVINITNSYEGIEGSSITIDNGKISIKASDDGINVASKNSNSTGNEVDGKNSENSKSETTQILTINNGNIYVDADGDGIDINGNGYINGGTIIVNGPTSNGDGALDYDGVLEVNGGTLIAAGSSGMLQTSSDSSKINCVSVVFDSSKEAESLISVCDSDDNEIITFAPSKKYQSVVICSSEIKTGQSYKIYLGGSSSKSNVNGLYEVGGYEKGELFSEIKIESVVSGNSGFTGFNMQNRRPGGR